jgi:energy-converting hydrogenase Eha subunit F
MKEKSQRFADPRAERQLPEQPPFAFYSRGGSPFEKEMDFK